MAVCKTCNDNGLIGGPSFYAPDEGGVPCPDCTPAPVAAVAWPVEWPDDAELEGWRSTADDLLRSLPELRGSEIRRAAHLLQNAYLFVSKAAALAASPSSEPKGGAA